MSPMISVLTLLLLIQHSHCRVLINKPNYIASSSKKHESMLYSCFINNAESEIMIHNDIPTHFKNNKNIESLHESLSLSISTFACYEYTRLNFTFSLQLIQNLYHKNGGFKVYKDGHLQPKPNFKQKYRSYFGDVAIFEYKYKSLSPTNVKHGKVTLTFLGNISIFKEEPNASEHPNIYKCQSFSAQIWTDDFLYEMKPIQTDKSSLPTCNTLTVSAIPMNKLNHFLQNPFFDQIISYQLKSSQKQSQRDLLEYAEVINRFDCSGWDDQWRHHHSIQVGLVIDQGFYDLFDNSDDLLDEYLASMFTNTNGLFTQQLNIHVNIGDVLITTDVPNYAGQTEWWLDQPYYVLDGNGQPTDQKTCDLQREQFSDMQTWSAAKWTHDYDNCTSAGYDYTTLSECPYIDQHGTWALLSACFTTGSASWRRLCRHGNYAITVNYDHDFVHWRIFAHELGHVCGALHLINGNGGIMDYGEQLYDGIHQFARDFDICSGLIKSRSSSTNYKPSCWTTYDYGVLNYEWWQQTGSYTACYPSCGDFQFKAEIVQCFTTNNISVDDSNCGLDLKPYGKFERCTGSETSVCDDSVCGNGQWEMNEECDTELLEDGDRSFECCQSDCTRSHSEGCSRLKKQIDAAFTDSNGKLYLFQGSQFAVYSSIDGNSGTIGAPDIGYPKSILYSFPMSAWSGNFDAAFCTSDNIVYIFKNFSYIRLDLNAIHIQTGNAQIDIEPMAIQTESHTFDFGYIPPEFGDCGRIDAAFVHSFDEATIVCGAIYHSWTIGSNVMIQNSYRPFFSDYEITFGDFYQNYYRIDAASYNWTEQTLRFYAADVYVDYVSGKQNGDEKKLQAMGYWRDNDNCGSDNCGNCEITHNEYCYDASYLVVIQFESESYDSEHLDSVTNVEYVDNGGVFSGSNAINFRENSKVTLKVQSSLYTTITHWRMSVWLYPTNYDNEQDFFHMNDQDQSSIILLLNTNPACAPNEQLTITVKHQTNDDEIVIFEDNDCRIPLQLNKWSKVTFDAVQSMVAITVNSEYETSNPIESQIDLAIAFESWYLGTNYIGRMDYFVFQETNGLIVTLPPTVSPTAEPVASACVFPFVTNIPEMIAWISVCVAMYTAAMWALYKYYGAKILLNHIARQLNMQQDQAQFDNIDNANDEAGAGNNNEVEMMVMNQPGQIQEAAAGMAVHVVEQILSGNVTPNFMSPKGKNVDDYDEPALQQHLLFKPKENFLSPKRIIPGSSKNRLSIYNNDDEPYDGNTLASPAKRSYK